jgi:hypothetical protein
LVRRDVDVRVRVRLLILASHKRDGESNSGVLDVIRYCFYLPFVSGVFFYTKQVSNNIFAQLNYFLPGAAQEKVPSPSWISKVFIWQHRLLYVHWIDVVLARMASIYIYS